MTRLALTASVLVHRSAVDVFAYVADLRRAREWRSEVLASELRPPGPVRLGARLREVSIIAGRRVVSESEIDGYEESRRISLRHRSGPLPVRTEYTVSAAVGGAVLRYDVDLELVGGWSLLAPVFRISWPQRMGESLDELRYRLESTRPVALPLAS
jgi:hypothetical protein